MTVFKLEESRRVRRQPIPLPVTDVLPVVGVDQVFVAQVRDELDDYFVTLKALNSRAPEEVFTFLSGVSARLCELRITCWRSESRRLISLRTHEIDPLIEEVDRQFRIHSRKQTCLAFEWEMTRAAPA